MKVVTFPPFGAPPPQPGTYYVITWERHGQWTDYLLFHGVFPKFAPSEGEHARQDVLFPLIGHQKGLRSRSCFVGRP